MPYLRSHGGPALRLTGLPGRGIVVTGIGKYSAIHCAERPIVFNLRAAPEASVDRRPDQLELIAAVVRTRRLRLRLSRESLARQAEVARNTIWRIELGLAARPDTYARLAPPLGLDVGWEDHAARYATSTGPSEDLVRVAVRFAVARPGPAAMELVELVADRCRTPSGRAAAEEACKVALGMLKRQGGGGSA